MPWGCFPGSRQPHPIAFQTHQAMGVWTRVRDSAGEPSKARVRQGMGVSVRKAWRARPPLQGQDSGSGRSQTTHWKETVLRPRALQGGEGGPASEERAPVLGAEGGRTCSGEMPAPFRGACDAGEFALKPFGQKEGKVSEESAQNPEKICSEGLGEGQVNRAFPPCS